MSTCCPVPSGAGERNAPRGARPERVLTRTRDGFRRSEASAADRIDMGDVHSLSKSNNN